MKTNDWISTKDRLPETNNDIDKFTHCSDEILICLNGNEVVTGKFFKIDYDCITLDGDYFTLKEIDLRKFYVRYEYSLGGPPIW